MSVEERLAAIQKRVFSEDFLDSILAAFSSEAKNSYYMKLTEEDYQKAKSILPNILSKEQASDLAKAEELCHENEQWLMRFGYTHGVFSGFQQYFTDKNAEDVFRNQVQCQVMQMPNMKRYQEYYNRRKETSALLEAASNGLDKADAEHIASIELLWMERFLGVLRHSFYTGYRYALSVLDDVQPGAPHTIMGKLLVTEHDLCFTQTVAERERFRQKSNPNPADEITL